MSKYHHSDHQSPGTFLEDKLPVMTFRDGADDELIEPIHYLAKDLTKYRCPTGSRTDGMSIPKAVKLIPGFNANRQDWFSSILHDGGYRGTLEKWDTKTNSWIPAKLNRKQTDKLMIESMNSGKVKNNAVYWPLRWLGWPNFKPKD